MQLSSIGGTIVVHGVTSFTPWWAKSSHDMDIAAIREVDSDRIRIGNMKDATGVGASGQKASDMVRSKQEILGTERQWWQQWIVCRGM